MNDARRADFHYATEQEHRACLGKMKLPSRKNATAVARSAERAFRDGAWNAYRCPFCRCWHVGHNRRA